MEQPTLKKIDSLVGHLKLGVGDPDKKSWGHAVFLIGAGCSLTAGVPTSSDVARICVLELRRRYNSERNTDPDFLKATYHTWKSHRENFHKEAQQALEALVTEGRIPKRYTELPEEEQWPALYTHIFEDHFTSLNQQRTIISGIIDEAGDKLNWASACLGELVRRAYVHTVLTTNFDLLALQGIIRTGILPVIADGIESLNRVAAQPNRPQVVHLHGSMHTYNPRNTRTAVLETGKDPTLRSVLYNVLQNCDVFVIVGYAGGEEGVMDLLCEAAARMKSLVIYWVLYESEHTRLSNGARRLLTIGENKFVLLGYDADNLFRDIMKGLGIGQPNWMQQSLRQPQDLENPLVIPEEREDEKSAPDIAIAIRSYWNNAQPCQDKQRSPTAKERWALLRLAGQDNRLLEEIIPETELDDELRLMRGLSAWSVAREEGREPKSQLEQVEKAIIDFKPITRAEGQTCSQRYTNYIRLLNALWFRYELTTDMDQVENESLQDLEQVVTEAMGLFRRKHDEAKWGEIQIHRAKLLQEKVPDSDNDEEAGRRLRRVIGTYRLILRDLPPTSYRRWADAKAGLAKALQRYGEINRDVQRLREAVEAWANLIMPNVSVAPREHAGSLQNLSSALVELSKLDRRRATELLQEAKRRAEDAVAIYEREGDAKDLDNARKLVGDIDLRLGGGERDPA
jgi:NAD-dependent SIR2 family protein deacetylase